MDKENEQEMEWLQAQKLEINVDLMAAAKQQLQFLATVDQNRWLYEGPSLARAIYRYNACWLPLLAKYSEDSSIRESPLVPPLDCEWVWHCHRLNPVRYKSDCEQLYGRVLDNSYVVSSTNGHCKKQTEDLWNVLYPEEPYDIDLVKADSVDVSEKMSALEKCTEYDLVSAVNRQSPFYYQVSGAHVNNDVFLDEAVARYKGFLHVIKRNRERSIKRFCVPTYDIDLIWHTHQLHPVSYCKDLEKAIGKILEHDDTDSDRSKGKKLDTGFSGTTAQWEETFGRRYWKAGAMYRGGAPAPVTNSPFASDLLGKEVSAEDSECHNVIQFPEVEAVEVLLEIVGVKNLPDGHKGKPFVVFSKTQPDSLFNTERRLTVLSESGQKQVASFQCEPKGELCFRLMASSPCKIPVSKEPKDLGSASLSLREFLVPAAKLSVEKWLDLTPPGNSKSDSKPVSLRVAVSITPPTRSPPLLTMVRSGSSLKGSCFPMLRKARPAKSSTLIVDETEAEVISLEMRNSNGGAAKGDNTVKKQVIGIKESGETLVLAEFTGKFWNLLDSKWSLKHLNSPMADGPLFQLLGSHLVKVYSGRKLDYEPKHCTKRRSDQDFMTAVEFSKQHPYGKAVGLLDLKFRSFEAKENWVVLPGIISAFILDSIPKKEGFGGWSAATEDEVEVGSEVNAAPENGGGCGSGCGITANAADSAGCGSECGGGCGGNTAKAAGSAGCGSGCSGCGGGCGGNMVKSGGCGGGCGGNMVKSGGCSGGCGGGCGGCGVGTLKGATGNSPAQTEAVAA
ncbi:PREDICTED: glycine-rich domain-containing protein 1-like [Tarenaya hassleriana]|uniref:glycine-rich domain-containing protein 1-like n=1 Tax=Tarenaya hassleriana TaxID=28532 RepID=UPI00053C1D3C|nr:PREDICTED: glycine-rich domain-containing protein 1-like [Tarenaya hassleriana]